VSPGSRLRPTPIWPLASDIHFPAGQVIGILYRGEHRQAAERAAGDIEGHPPADEHGQPGRLSMREIDVATDAEKYRGANRRGDRHQRMRIPLVRSLVFLYFALSLSLKIVWVARSDQVRLPSAADSPRAQHRLRRALAVEVL
jgi:hypothetical protein